VRQSRQKRARRSHRPRGEAAALRARGEAARGKAASCRGKAAYNLVAYKYVIMTTETHLNMMSVGLRQSNNDAILFTTIAADADLRLTLITTPLFAAPYVALQF